MDRNGPIVRVNGEAKPLDVDGLVQLLERQGLDPARPGIAVALNGEVVPRTEWDRRSLSDGDEVEIVGAVQGG